MAEMTSYVGIQPRTVIPTSTALVRGVRVTRNSSGLCAVSAAIDRGDYVTITDAAASEPVQVASMDGGGKVPALTADGLTNNTTAIGEIAYGAANGMFSNVSTSAAVVGKWTTITAENGVLGEVELCSPVV